MEPPLCVICLAPLRPSEFTYEDFTLVEFRAVRTYPDDWAGHPENCVWYCPRHLPLTEGLTHLSVREAQPHIKARLRATGETDPRRG